MIKRLSLIFLLFLSATFRGQITFSEQHIDLGQLGTVSEIKGDVVINNSGKEKIHLLRASADEGVLVYTSKRTLQPGDTALLILSFEPKSAGRFLKHITLLTTDKKGTYAISMSGQIEKIRHNDLTACYYFGSGRTRLPRNQKSVIIPEENARLADKYDLSQISEPKVTSTTEPEAYRKPLPEPKPAKDQGPLEGNLPNNILLLVDISSSMRDSLKLPLMKEELHHLINAIRDVDSVTLITYADSVKVRLESVSGSNKKQLHDVVNSLKARGMTKGKKAILFSQEMAQKHYIKGGNNLIIMASDGKFRFLEEDQRVWDERQSNGAVMLTTVAFGDDREAIRTLKQIAAKGEGTFIHIKRRKDSGGRILEEVKLRSQPPAANR